MRTRERAARVLLLLVTTTLHAGERTIVVTTPDGAWDATASVACADPEAPAVAVHLRKGVTIPESCRRVRCESERWRAGSAIPGPSGPMTCALMPAVQVGIDLPRGAGGTLVVSLKAAGAATPAFETVSSPRALGPRPRVSSPPLAPGPYELAVGRPDGSWRCNATMVFVAPERVSVFVPWRDPLLVEGRVLTADGQGLAGVPVTSTTDGARVPQRGSPPSGRIEEWRCGVPPSGPTHSGPDGAFGIMVDPTLQTLVVAGGWDHPRGIDFASRRGPRADPLRLVPVIPHRALALVLDEGDHPVACRARLMIDDSDELWAARVLPGVPSEIRCPADGLLDVGPFRAETFEIDLRSDVALPLRVQGAVPPGATQKDLGVIRLDGGGSLRVTVGDEARAPIAGASVTVTSGQGFVMERSVRTGADGSAVIRGLPTDATLSAVIEAEGFGQAFRDDVVIGNDIAVTLRRAGSVNGRVATDYGAPIRAHVRASAAAGHPLAEADTDESGAFSFPSLPEGVALLQATAQGYRPADPVRIALERGRADEPVVLVLRAATELRGLVVDPQRSPLSGAMVLIAPARVLSEPPEALAWAATRTTRDGSFAIDATGAPDEIVVALASGYGPAVVLAGAHTDASALELVVTPEARLLVRLPRSLPADATMAVTDSSGLTRLIPARARQEILVEGLTPGAGEVALRTGQRKAVRLIAGETAAVDLLAGARVRGQVRREGRPEPRAAVTVALVGAGSIASGDGVLTGHDGRFAFDGIGPGEYLLVAIAARGRTERRIVVPADGELDVDLDVVERGLRVAVRAAGSAAPVAGARLTAAPRGTGCTAFADATEVVDGVGWAVTLSDGGCARGTSGSDGSASLALASSGPHLVTVEAAGFTQWTGTVNVVDGVTDLVTDLERGGPPLVRVAIETDPPGIAGSIYCVQDGRSVSRGPVAGETICEGLSPGRAEVAFRAAEFGVARSVVDVPESGEALVTLRVPRGGQLVAPLESGAPSAIRVIDERGVVWNLSYGLGWPRCTIEPRDGVGSAYVCHEIPPGTYTVEVGGRRRPAVAVRGGEVTLAY